MAVSSVQNDKTHVWRFFRAGGFDQVQLDSGRDLLALETLDQKLWVALSCPVAGVVFDRRTLELIDTDQDGHIRVPEILAAFAWIAPRLRDPDLLLKGDGCVSLDAINPETGEGESLLVSARTILENLGRSDATEVSIDDACDTEQIFAQTRFNGDGIVTPASTDDEALKAWIGQIIDTLGGEQDRSGEPGVGAAQMEQFATAAAAWLAWQDRQVGDQAGGLAPESREEAVGLWVGLKPKIEDYFIRCRMAAYDGRAAQSMNAAEEALLTLAPRNLAEAGEDIAVLPLSAVTAEQSLDLVQGINPAWVGRIGRFCELIALPLLGETQRLTAAQWEELKSLCVPYEAWWADRVETPVAVLGRERLSAWNDEAVATALQALIDKDLALQAAFEAIVDVERFTRYCRDLATLANNFVSFRDFYTGRGKAIFQSGTLYMDGRSCELCVSVTDVAKHAQLATLSRVFLVYCDCVRDGGKEKMTIAAAFTNGDSDQLMVGRNGVFYDRQGRDWDATVVRILEHPISIRQAFWSPYKRIGKMVGEQVQKMAAARSKAAEDRAAASLMQAGMPAKEAAKPAPQQQLFDVGKFAGIFAAIGLAVGAIGTALVSLVTGFIRLAWWQMPLALAAILLVISGPAVLIAWFKLHQRNLGPILDANSWAVNARARLNIPFGASLTGIPRLPAGSQQTLRDPYAEKKSPWKFWLFLVVVALLLFMAWKWKLLDTFTSCQLPPSAKQPLK